VIIGSNAVILGDITVGAGAKIGSGAVVVKPVPPGATVVGVPGRIVRGPGAVERPRVDLDHAALPDPVAEAIRILLEHIEKLEQRMHRVEETCNKLAAWTEEELTELESSRRYIRASWLDANGLPQQNPVPASGEDMGQARES